MPTSTPENRPPLEPRWQRVALIDDIQDSLRNHSDAAAVLINENLESIVVLEGTVESFDQGERSFFAGNSLSLIFFRENKVSVVLHQGASRIYRQNCAMIPTAESLDELGENQAQMDSQLRFQLSRTTFSPELAEQRIEWYRSIIAGPDMDIALRIQQVDELE